MVKLGLDVGHGLYTPGKQTPDGIKEWTLNDKVADKVADMLAPYDVSILRTDNNEGKTDESLSNRVATYLNAGVASLVSIHHNAFKGVWGKATGVEVYVDRNCTEQDLKLANLIYTRLVRYTGLTGRGVKKANFHVINQNKVTAVLVEGGFMDGTNDYKIITSDAGQTAYAKAVAESLIEFHNLKKKTTATTKPTTGGTCKVELKTLKKGVKGESVKALQALLIGYGFTMTNNGKTYGIDGSFGAATENALKSYQRSVGLNDDGSCGPKTWAKLLGTA
jgi:N-acetylmuramoyl-L-alanine amidase